MTQEELLELIAEVYEHQNELEGNKGVQENHLTTAKWRMDEI